MLNPKIIEDLAEKFSQNIPPGAKAFQKDIESSFKQAMQSVISRLDLVTREEFDVQTKVLARTREKIEQLEKRLDEIQQDNN
jgi:BMFP domain-containing protein YqiC